MEMVPTYGQTFITTAKESDIGDYRQGITRFRVHEGTVTPCD
jgi:recombinational DNA repair ATPase RecF